MNNYPSRWQWKGGGLSFVFYLWCLKTRIHSAKISFTVSFTSTYVICGICWNRENVEISKILGIYFKFIEYLSFNFQYMVNRIQYYNNVEKKCTISLDYIGIKLVSILTGNTTLKLNFSVEEMWNNPLLHYRRQSKYNEIY